MLPGREQWKWILAPLVFSASFSAPGILPRARIVPNCNSELTPRQTTTAYPNGTSYTSVQEIQQSSSKTEIHWKAAEMLPVKCDVSHNGRGNLFSRRDL